MKDLQKHFVEAYNKGVSVKKLCAQYDICKSTAYNWIRKYSSIKRTQGKTITAEAYYKLERENRTLRTENEILKRCGCAFESPLADIEALLSPVVDILIIPLPLFDIVAFLLAWIAVSEAL